MIQTLIRNWWLLALCGVLEAVFSATYFIMQDADGSLALRTYVLRGTVVVLGEIALAAGACAIAAAIWRPAGRKCWLLALNGLAFIAFGVIPIFLMTGRHGFLPFALMLDVMAVSGGALAWAMGRSLQRHGADQWLLGVAGAGSVGFALAFFVLGFRWVRLEQPGSLFLWMGSYFGFSAICMLALALRLHSLGLAQSGEWDALGKPKHAH